MTSAGVPFVLILVDILHIITELFITSGYSIDINIILGDVLQTLSRCMRFYVGRELNGSQEACELVLNGSHVQLSRTFWWVKLGEARRYTSPSIAQRFYCFCQIEIVDSDIPIFSGIGSILTTAHQPHILHGSLIVEQRRARFS